MRVGTQSYKEFLESYFGSFELPLLVINTHCHFDHIGGNSEFSDIAASSYDKAFTLAALDQDRDTSLAKQLNCPINNYQVTRWLDHEEQIEIGDNDFLVVLHTPGHTPDSICLWLPSDSILFAGDTLYPYVPITVTDLQAFRTSINYILHFLPSHATIACGHITNSFQASELSTCLALVDDIIAKKISSLPPIEMGSNSLIYERDESSILYKK